jgi:hypothetical protein
VKRCAPPKIPDKITGWGKTDGFAHLVSPLGSQTLCGISTKDKELFILVTTTFVTCDKCCAVVNKRAWKWYLDAIESRHIGLKPTVNQTWRRFNPPIVKEVDKSLWPQEQQPLIGNLI